MFKKIPCIVSSLDVSTEPNGFDALHVYVPADLSLVSDILRVAIWLSYVAVMLVFNTEISLPFLNLKKKKNKSLQRVNITQFDCCYVLFKKSIN